MNYLLLFLPFVVLVMINLLPKAQSRVVAFWATAILFLVQILTALFSFSSLWNEILSRDLEIFFGFQLLLPKAGHILLFSSGLAGLSALIIGWFTIKQGEDRNIFINLLLISLIGLNGIAMVNDLFTLYVFIEVTALATFILMALFRDKAALEGVWKYLILSVVATVLMLTAVALFILVAGGTSFLDVQGAMLTSPIALLAMALFLCGLFIKGGMVPFHGWLADAYMTAPSAVSLFMAGIVTKASGLYALIRLVHIICLSSQLLAILLAVGSLSIVVGALAALGQKDLKRLLAYSSISQMGYIVVALGTGTKLGLFAALFHFLNHVILKSQLFANAAAIEEQVGHRDMDNMGGLAQRMPITGSTSVLAMLSTAGLPPLSGFWSKLLIILALWLSQHYFYAVVAVLASIITLAYFLSLQRRVFFGQVPPGLNNVQEARLGMLLPAVSLAIMTVIIGLLFPILIMFLR